MYGLNQNSSAFSLLELLVVVAIILILVAIAAPNYQEAITRSKVTRFMGDAKRAELGIETYMTDYAVYPPADRYPVQSTCGPWQSEPMGPARGYLTRRLTTPTAYLTKLPRDIFQNTEDASTCIPDRSTMIYSNDMQNRPLYGATSQQNYVSWTYAQLKGEAVLTERPSNAIWMVSSAGPDLNRDHGRDTVSTGDPGYPVQYDPSNGTISDGDLYLFGPGIGYGLAD